MKSPIMREEYTGNFSTRKTAPNSRPNSSLQSPHHRRHRASQEATAHHSLKRAESTAELNSELRQLARIVGNTLSVEDLQRYLKVDEEQCSCHKMRVPDGTLKMHYPKNLGSMYTKQYNGSSQKKLVASKSQIFNRDFEKG